MFEFNNFRKPNLELINKLKPKPYKLKNIIQHYEWGTKGKNAFIPKLLDVKAKKGKPYAELWMGAHPKASSRIKIDGKEIELLKAIKKYPTEMLGSNTAKRFSNTLPFLFKVLSANEALSIQIHPNKNQAVLLNKKDPVNYPDANQKHEVAVALDSLTALVGFKPFHQIIKTLKDYPEIENFIGKRFIRSSLLGISKTVETVNNVVTSPILCGINPAEDLINTGKINRFNGLPISLLSIENQKKFVKSVFKELIRKSSLHPNELNFTIENLHHRISKKKIKAEIEKYFLQLHKKYGNDAGLLLLFFLNLVYLKRGEAIFTKPGVPHAYLNGNILECMSNSDNVIRAGLTPKYKDVDSLFKVLTYELSSPKIIKGKKRRNSLFYQTEAKEFELQLFNLSINESVVENNLSARILLILKGEIMIKYLDKRKPKIMMISKGESVFLPSSLPRCTIHPVKPSQFVLVSVPPK